MRAQLWYAPLPVIGLLAVHYWFVTIDERGRQERWEVWQRKNAGGISIGHMHRNLKPPEENVGGGPSRLAAEWTGNEAAALFTVLARSRSYPHCQRYRYWPGPNSNTFVAWVLREAGIQHPLIWKAFGKRYRA